MKRFTKRTTVVVSTIAALATAGGVAFAYWTTSGTGSGSGTTGTASNVTLTVAFPVISDLGTTVTATSATLKNNSTTGTVSVAGKHLNLDSIS